MADDDPGPPVPVYIPPPPVQVPTPPPPDVVYATADQVRDLTLRVVALEAAVAALQPQPV